MHQHLQEVVDILDTTPGHRLEAARHGVEHILRVVSRWIGKRCPERSEIQMAHARTAASVGHVVEPLEHAIAICTGLALGCAACVPTAALDDAVVVTAVARSQGGTVAAVRQGITAGALFDPAEGLVGSIADLGQAPGVAAGEGLAEVPGRCCAGLHQTVAVCAVVGLSVVAQDLVASFHAGAGILTEFGPGVGARGVAVGLSDGVVVGGGGAGGVVARDAVAGLLRGAGGTVVAVNGEGAAGVAAAVVQSGVGGVVVALDVVAGDPVAGLDGGARGGDGLGEGRGTCGETVVFLDEGGAAVGLGAAEGAGHVVAEQSDAAGGD